MFEQSTKLSSLSPNEVFLSRALDLCDSNGLIESTVTVLIGQPYETATGEWSCAYQILGIAELDGAVYRVMGVDSVQALVNAFTVIEATLSGTDVVKRGLLRWCGQHQPPFLR